jgi:hypothetical protein
MAYTGGLDFDKYLVAAYGVFKFDLTIFERCARM